MKPAMHVYCNFTCCRSPKLAALYISGVRKFHSCIAVILAILSFAKTLNTLHTTDITMCFTCHFSFNSEPIKINTWLLKYSVYSVLSIPPNNKTIKNRSGLKILPSTVYHSRAEQKRSD